ARGEGRAPSALLHVSGGRLVLEGISFLLVPGERDDPQSAILAEGADLTLRRCSFPPPASRGSLGRIAALQVRSPARATPDGGRPAPVVVDASYFGGGQVGILAEGSADLVLRDCTFGMAEPAVWLDNAGAASDVPVALHLVHVSILAGTGPVFRFDRTEA